MLKCCPCSSQSLHKFCPCGFQVVQSDLNVVPSGAHVLSMWFPGGAKWSLCATMCHCVQLFVTVYHCVSLYVTMCHCFVTLCYCVSLCATATARFCHPITGQITHPWGNAPPPFMSCETRKLENSQPRTLTFFQEFMAAVLHLHHLPSWTK